jgi:hypothetical protein
MMFDMRVANRTWSEAQAGDVMVVTNCYEDILSALRGRKDGCGFTCIELEQRAGLPSGYVTKLLGPRRTKNLGPLSFDLMMGALGLHIAIIADEAPIPLTFRRENQVRKPKPRAVAA